MSDAVTFQLGTGTSRIRKRRRVLAASTAAAVEPDSAAVTSAFASIVAARDDVDGNDERVDYGDPAVVIENVDVIAAPPASPLKDSSSPLALPDAVDGSSEAQERNGAPVSQIARLIERRRLKVSAGALDEDAAYRMDISQCPDEATADAYSRVPVESFGASLLKCMGWDGKPDARSDALAGAPVSRLRGGEPGKEIAPASRRKRQRVPLKTNGTEYVAENDSARQVERRGSGARNTPVNSQKDGGAPSTELRGDGREVRGNDTGRGARADDVTGSSHVREQGRDRKTVGNDRVYIEERYRYAQSVFDGGSRARHDRYGVEHSESYKRELRDQDGDRSRRDGGHKSRFNDRYGSGGSRYRSSERERDSRDRGRADGEHYASRTEDEDRRRRR